MSSGTVEHTPPIGSSGIETIIDCEHWLAVAASTTMLFVHRSIQLWDDDPVLAPVWALIGDSEPVVPMVIVPDPGMMGAHAEHSIYAL